MRLSAWALAAVATVGCSALDSPRKADSTSVQGFCEIAVTPASVVLQLGDVITLSVRTCAASGVRWSSSAPDVAPVDSATGMVRALALGTATNHRQGKG